MSTTESESNCNQLGLVPIERRIYVVRGTQVMIDLDLASLYGVENRSLRQTVRRNIDSFPDDFMFTLTNDEANELITRGVSQSVIPPGYNTGGAEMFAFTEHGVAMLATVLKSAKARMISIEIMRAFVAMRHFLLSNAQVFQRLDRIELKQLETDHKIEQVFEKLEEKAITPKQGIFFDGQIYDAYEFICGLIKSAKTRIVLIDNYVDDSVLTMLDKRETGVPATVRSISSVHPSKTLARNGSPSPSCRKQIPKCFCHGCKTHPPPFAKAVAGHSRANCRKGPVRRWCRGRCRASGMTEFGRGR